MWDQDMFLISLLSAMNFGDFFSPKNHIFYPPQSPIVNGFKVVQNFESAQEPIRELLKGHQRSYE